MLIPLNLNQEADVFGQIDQLSAKSSAIDAFERECDEILSNY